MSVHKRTYRSGKTSWFYVFDARGSTREDRRQVTGSGYATRKEAIEAEAERRIEEQRKHEQQQRGGVAPMPKTLDMLLQEFFAEHAERKLAAKTVARYSEQADYLSPELLAMPISEITPLHLAREWNRLLERGGRHRRTKEPRPLSAKTVRLIAGVVSAAFSRAVKWGLVKTNPVADSEPPTPRKHAAAALTPAQQELLIEAATSPWCLRVFLLLAAATGCRRGELLALRWSDVVGGRARIERSLAQVKGALEFKGTKTGRPRVVALPESALMALEAHRRQQEEFRGQFGPDYRADLNLVFTNPDGTPLRPDSISAAVSALFRRLKIPKPKGCALHLFRHSHGSQLLASGVPLPAVSERLGHSSTYVTATVYAHALHGQDEEAARRWEEFQRRGAQPGIHAGSKPV
jgi:integrase